MQMNDNREIEWPLAAVLISLAIVLGLALQPVAGCEARTKEAYFKAQVENNKTRFEHDKWLLEKGYTKESKIR